MKANKIRVINGTASFAGPKKLNIEQQGKVSEELIDRAVIRLMTTRMRLGMFDQVESFDSIPYSANDCEEHRQINRETARKSTGSSASCTEPCGTLACTKAQFCT